MPKNSNWGQNTKAVEAKVRKSTALKATQEKKQKAAEDAYWDDDDKSLARKQNRKEDKEKKRLEKLDRKTTTKQIEEEESKSIVKSSTQAPAKITQAQIQAEKERREAAARKSAAAMPNPKLPKLAPIEENLNRLINLEDEARTVDEALKMLTVSASPAASFEKHPEKRVRAAYAAFEEARLAQTKAENPALRLTQLKQIIFNEWKKSPENPMNQEQLAYNAKLLK